MKKTLALLLTLVLLFTFCVTAVAAPPDMPEGMMSGAMGAPPAGGGPGMGGGAAAPSLYTIDETGLTTLADAPATLAVTAGDVTDAAAQGLTVEGADYGDALFSVAGGSYRIGGAEDVYTVSVNTASGTLQEGFNSVIRLLEGDKLGASAGPAASVSGGALYIDNTYIAVEGSQRYAVSASAGLLAVNDSFFVCQGATENTTADDAPMSNPALLVSGYTRTNMSVGTSQTYYYNSTVLTDGWAAMSTDSAMGDGLDFYAYNSLGYAMNGGYGTYADSNCRDWFYGSTVLGAELGAILSNNGQVHLFAGSQADENALQYLAAGGATTDAASLLAGGRNAVQIHSPDMMGQGAAFGSQAVLTLSGSVLSTTTDLVSDCDYYQTYGDAVGRYVDFISGADILVKSHSADIDLYASAAQSYSNTLLMTAVNSDSMGRWLKAGNYDTPTTLTLTDCDLSGDVLAYDYQRSVNVALSGTFWVGAASFWTADDWNGYWSAYATQDDACCWLLDGSVYQTDGYGVDVTLDDGSVWVVSGPSHISSLTLAQGAVVIGSVEVLDDGTLLLDTADFELTADEWAKLAPLDPNPTVVVSDQALTVNGYTAVPAAYNINGSNYFKLRDLAQLLNTTSGQFAVVYDEAADSITLTPGQAYAALGTELTPVDAPAAVAVSTQQVLLDGADTGLNAYNIGGSNYFKLRDLADILGFAVSYDEATRTVVIQTP